MNAITVQPREAYGDVLGSDTLRLERLLPGPIERVWLFLTDSEKRKLWLAAGEMDLVVGGRVEHVFRNSQLSRPDDCAPPKYAGVAGEHRMEGRIKAVEPPRLLSYTWGDTSEVTFELEPVGDRVRLVVTHRRLVGRDTMLSVAAGWHAHVALLAAQLEGRTPESFWELHTRLEAEYDRRLPGA